MFLHQPICLSWLFTTRLHLSIIFTSIHICVVRGWGVRHQVLLSSLLRVRACTLAHTASPLLCLGLSDVEMNEGRSRESMQVIRYGPTVMGACTPDHTASPLSRYCFLETCTLLEIPLHSQLHLPAVPTYTVNCTLYIFSVTGWEEILQITQRRPPNRKNYECSMQLYVVALCLLTRDVAVVRNYYYYFRGIRTKGQKNFKNNSEVESNDHYGYIYIYIYRYI